MNNIYEDWMFVATKKTQFYPKHVECAFCNSAKTNTFAFQARNFSLIFILLPNGIEKKRIKHRRLKSKVSSFKINSTIGALLVLHKSPRITPCLFTNILCILLAIFSCSFIHSLAEECLVNSNSLIDDVTT